MKPSGLFKFIKFFGSQQAAADAIGVKQQAISNWFGCGSKPYKQILKIVCVTKGFVQPSELAPGDKELGQLLDELFHLYREAFQAQDSNFLSSNNINKTNPSIIFDKPFMANSYYNEDQIKLTPREKECLY